MRRIQRCERLLTHEPLAPDDERKCHIHLAGDLTQRVLLRPQVVSVGKIRQRLIAKRRWRCGRGGRWQRGGHETPPKTGLSAGTHVAQEQPRRVGDPERRWADSLYRARGEPRHDQLCEKSSSGATSATRLVLRRCQNRRRPTIT